MTPDRTLRAWEILREIPPTPRARRNRARRALLWALAWLTFAGLALRAVLGATLSSGPAWASLGLSGAIFAGVWFITRK